MSDQADIACGQRRVRVLRRLSGPSLIALLVVLAALVPGASATAAAESCPAGAPAPAGSTPAAPLPKEIPAPPGRLLACVASSGITGATFDHWALVARKATVSPGSHARRHRSAKARREQVKLIVREVMNFLISSDWVLDEGRALGLEVSDGKVHSTFEHIRHQQFKKHGEFRKFLRRSGQTITDLLFRVRLNLVSQAIQSHVSAGKSGKAKMDALTEFVKTFRATWSAQTTCVTAFAVADCGAVRASL